jgi:hypothetical protein
MRFRVVGNFWEGFYDLPAEQKESVRQAWLVFKRNPFDPRLRSHRIHRLSARYNATIYSAVIEGNLRVLFRIDGDVVTTLDIGTHDIYR